MYRAACLSLYSLNTLSTYYVPVQGPGAITMSQRSLSLQSQSSQSREGEQLAVTLKCDGVSRGQ